MLWQSSNFDRLWYFHSVETSSHDIFRTSANEGHKWAGEWGEAGFMKVLSPRMEYNACCYCN